jgi:hypothetical protein
MVYYAFSYRIVAEAKITNPLEFSGLLFNKCRKISNKCYLCSHKIFLCHIRFKPNILENEK